MNFSSSCRIRARTTRIDLCYHYRSKIRYPNSLTKCLPLTHVSLELLPAYKCYYSVMQQALDAQRQHQHKILSQALGDAHRQDSQIKLSKSLKEGRPADIIVQTAIDDQVDLIVISSRGLGGVKQLFLGSVSDRVADEAPCPVLIVK